MKKMWSSVKLMGLSNFLCRRSMKIYTTNIYYSYVSARNYHKAATTAVPSFTWFRWAHCYLQASPCSYFPGNPQGKYHGTEDAKGENYSLTKKTREQLLEEVKTIKKGDMINLHDLLFTKNRDYLVKYNDDQQVKAAQLAGKVIVLYFVRLERYPLESAVIISLIEAYTYLLPDNVFEVVLVAYETKEDILSISSTSHTSSEKQFEAVFSLMPWTAIPFSDITSRERLFCRFAVNRLRQSIASFVIDSSGMVLQSDSCDLFDKYGGLGYPFTDERIKFLKSQVDATVKQPSLKSLLASPKRDYVISNKGDKVPVDTLEEKVVALYFYEEGVTSNWLTENIKMAYEEFGQNKSSFEVVLIYLYDTMETCDNTSEESFWNTFKTMPWLALPFKDPKCRELQRYFGYPYTPHGPEEPPTLVIIGPFGKFIEPWGAHIINDFKLSAYPFTREKIAKLDTEKVRELKLEMLWDPNTLFRGKDGSKVRFSQLVGKRIILFFEGNDYQQKVVEFLIMLEERYLDLKGTSDEFEVIYITSSEKESPYNEHIAYMQWFVSLASELLPIDLGVYRCYCHLKSGTTCLHRGTTCLYRGGSSILAFDRDGRVVRKSLDLSFDHIDFPFYAGDMQKEAFFELNNFYRWWELDCYHCGLLINSYYRNAKIPYIVVY